MKNVTKIVYVILTVVFMVPSMETIISVIGDSNIVLATICKVFYAFAIGAAIVKGLAKVNEFIHPNKKSHMKNAHKAMKRTRGARKVATILLSIIGVEALLVGVLCKVDKLDSLPNKLIKLGIPMKTAFTVSFVVGLVVIAIASFVLWCNAHRDSNWRVAKEVNKLMDKKVDDCIIKAREVAYMF